MFQTPTIPYTAATRQRLLAEQRARAASNAARYRVPAWRRILGAIDLPPVDWRNVGVGLLAGAWLLVFALVAMSFAR